MSIYLDPTATPDEALTNEGKTYTIEFTQGDIRRALHNLADGTLYEDGNRYTSDQLDYIADQIIGDFDETFFVSVREFAAWGGIDSWGKED